MVDIKKELINYMSNEIKIKNLELDKAMISSDYGISSIEISENTTKTNKINDPVGSLVCNKQKEIMEIDNKILKLKIKQKKLINLLEVLSVEEKKIITYKYMQTGIGLITWQDIALRMSMCYGTVKSTYNRAIKKMQQIAN